jgi:hypothetical protein
MAEGETITVHGRPIRCRHCGSCDVTEGGGNLEHVVPVGEGESRALRAFVCEHCGSVQLFLSSARVAIEPARLHCAECGAELPADVEGCPFCGAGAEHLPAPPTYAGDAEPCLACGARMGAGVEVCEACGWTYGSPAPAADLPPPPTAPGGAPPPPPPPPAGDGPSVLETPPTAVPALEACGNCGAPRVPGAGICRACGRLYDG